MRAFTIIGERLILLRTYNIYDLSRLLQYVQNETNRSRASNESRKVCEKKVSSGSKLDYGKISRLQAFDIPAEVVSYSSYMTIMR